MTGDPHAAARLERVGAPPERARLGLVMLHGRGASADDMIRLFEHLAIPDIAAAAPTAAGHSWWPTSFLAPHDALEPYLGSALQAAARAVDALGMPAGRLVVMGFSQGACLACEYAARASDAPMALAALSGGLVGTGDADGPAEEALYGHGPKHFDYASRREGMRALIGCHERDPHIPLDRVRASAQVLQSLGAEVTLQVHLGAGHGIVADEIRWLRALLNASPD